MKFPSFFSSILIVIDSFTTLTICRQFILYVVFTISYGLLTIKYIRMETFNINFILAIKIKQLFYNFHKNK